jgi:hypothetical protein
MYPLCLWSTTLLPRERRASVRTRRYARPALMASVAAQLSSIDAVDRLELTADGRIVDFLDPTVTRVNTPEERVRQAYARKFAFRIRLPEGQIAIWLTNPHRKGAA